MILKADFLLCAQGSLLAVFGGLYAMLGIDPGWATCKTSGLTLCSCALSSPDILFIFFFSLDLVPVITSVYRALPYVPSNAIIASHAYFHSSPVGNTVPSSFQVREKNQMWPSFWEGQEGVYRQVISSSHSPFPGWTRTPSALSRWEILHFKKWEKLGG